MARLTFLGDIMVTREQLESYRRKDGYEFDNALAGIKSALKDSDYAIANLETPIAGEDRRYTFEDYSFNTPKEILSVIKEVGISMVQTANNHCLDRGVIGLQRTIDSIRKAGLDYIGTHEKQEDIYKIIDIGGIKVGFIAATYGTNAFINHERLNRKNAFIVDMLQNQEISRWYEKIIFSSSMTFLLRCARFVLRRVCKKTANTPVYEIRQKSKKQERWLRNQILLCKNGGGAEYVIVLPHIGGQYNSEPTEYTRHVVDFCRDCGADAVIANHEHVIHSFIRDNEFFACYSLGNLLSSTGILSNPMDRLSEYSVIYHLDLEKGNDSRIQTKVSFQLFCSHLDKAGMVITEPVHSWIEECDEIHIKNKICSDVNILLNRIYQTENIEYDIEHCYKL